MDIHDNSLISKYENIFLLVFLLPFKILAVEYIYEVGGTNTSADASTIEYPDGSKFIVYHGEYAAWKDSRGDYGREKCIGYISVNLVVVLTIIYFKKISP